MPAVYPVRQLRILIGADQQDWSAYYGVFTVGYESLSEESDPGKIPITAQLEIKPSWGNPESIDPLANPTRWRVGQDVYIQTRNDADDAWLDTPYSRLKIVALPSRPGRGSLLLELGCKILSNNQSKFDDDRSGIIYGQAETADAVAQRLLEASDLTAGDISLTTWPYSLDRPIGKRGQNSYLNQAADLAYANNWHYLHQNSSGQIVATELSLASTGAIATVTIGQNDITYEPLPDPERPAEVTKVSGLGYELDTIDNPSVDIEEETGDFNDISPNSFGEGIFTRTITTESFTTGANPTKTKRVQVFKAEALMFQNPTIPSQLREETDETEIFIFETGKIDPTTARQTRRIRTKLQNGRTLDPTDEIFNMREIERDDEDVTYGSSEPMTRYQLNSTQAEIILDKNSTNPWNKVTVEDLDFNWSEHKTGKFDRTDKTKQPLLRIRSNIDRGLSNPTALSTRTRNYNRSQPNKPFDTVYFDAGIDEGETEFTDEVKHMPPGGPAGYEKERLYTVARGMAFSAAMPILAAKHRDLAIGRERGYLIELAVNDALLQSPPFPETDVVDTDSQTYTYIGDALSFEFTPTSTTAGCSGIWISGGYPNTVNIAGVIPQGVLDVDIVQVTFAIAGTIPTRQLTLNIIQQFSVAGSIPQGILSLSSDAGIVIAGVIPAGDLNLDIQADININGVIPAGDLILNVSPEITIASQLPQGDLGINVSPAINIFGQLPQGNLDTTVESSSSGINFSNVILLLHFEGSNGSTTFTDSSSANRAIGVNTGATISNAQSRFGSTSGSFDGNNGSISTGGTSPFTAAGDFCVELFVYGTDWSIEVPGGNNRCLVSFANGGTIAAARPTLLMSAAGEVLLFNGTIRITSSALSLNTWYHVAWYRVSGVHYLAIDGVVQATTYSDTTTLNPNIFRIGASTNENAGNLPGFIDEFRYVVGESPYGASNFTPPSGPHPDS